VPVLLGSGARIFDQNGAEQVELTRTIVVGSPSVTHLHFQVER